MEIEFRREEVYPSDIDLLNVLLCATKYSSPSRDGNYYLMFTEEDWFNYQQPYPSQRKYILQHAIGTIKRAELNGRRIADIVGGYKDGQYRYLVQIPATEVLEEYLKEKNLADYLDDAKFISVE